MAKNLQDYGYDVLWNADARTVKITKPEGKSMKSFDKKEIEKLTQRRVVGKKEFDVYKTDIKTMFDDTIQTKSNDLPTAINVNGRTLVLFSALGKHFGKVEYNDEQRVASIWDGGEEDVISTEKIYVEELGVSYQKTGRFDLSGCSIFKSQTAAKDLNLTIENAWQKVVDVICISKTMGTTVTENYFSVSPALMELLSIQVTIQSENALLLGTEKVSIELKNANTVRNFVPVFANKTDLQLYTQDGKLIENEVFPAFLCIDNQLYISADALAKSMSMEHTLDGYGYGDGVFRKK